MPGEESKATLLPQKTPDEQPTQLPAKDVTIEIQEDSESDNEEPI